MSQPVIKYLQIFTDINDKFFGWKSNGFSEESVMTPVTSSNSFIPKLTYIHNSKKLNLKKID